MLLIVTFELQCLTWSNTYSFSHHVRQDPNGKSSEKNETNDDVCIDTTTNTNEANEIEKSKIEKNDEKGDSSIDSEGDSIPALVPAKFVGKQYDEKNRN